MDILAIVIFVMVSVTIAQIFVGFKYLKTFKSVEKRVKEMKAPFFTQDITKRETLDAIEKKVERILEEMIKLTDNISRVKNAFFQNQKK